MLLAVAGKLFTEQAFYPLASFAGIMSAVELLMVSGAQKACTTTAQAVNAGLALSVSAANISVITLAKIVVAVRANGMYSFFACVVSAAELIMLSALTGVVAAIELVVFAYGDIPSAYFTALNFGLSTA